MKVSVPVLLTAPVLAIVILLSIIAFVEAKATVNDLMAQHLVQIHEHIEQSLKEYLNLPKQIQRLNTNLIAEGVIELNNLRAWGPILFEQIKIFDGLSRITWVGADGQSVGLARHSDRPGYEFTIKDDQTGKNIQKFNCDPMGRVDQKPFKSYPYNPLEKPWYRAVTTNHQPPWKSHLLIPSRWSRWAP